eukprot:1232035-Rhodomonas_salina.1
MLVTDTQSQSRHGTSARVGHSRCFSVLDTFCRVRYHPSPSQYWTQHNSAPPRKVRVQGLLVRGTEMGYP